MSCYDNLPPKQAANLRKGSKLRYSMAIQGLMKSLENMCPGTFLPHEMNQIQEIMTNVQKRAETAHQEEYKVINNPEASSRTETQQRTFNGK